MHRYKSGIREGGIAVGVEDLLLNETCSKILSQRSWRPCFDSPVKKYYRDVGVDL